LVDQRQHLLGLRLGRGEEASSPAGGREDGFSNAHEASVGTVWIGRSRIPSGSDRDLMRALAFARRAVVSAGDGLREAPDRRREGLRPIEIGVVRGTTDQD